MAKQQATQTANVQRADSGIGAILASQLAAVDQHMRRILEHGALHHDEPAPRVAEESDEEIEEGLHEVSVFGLSDQEAAMIDTLQDRAKRLRQVQQLLTDDPELLHVVDASIRNRVGSAQRRQAMLSVVLAILSLIAGWLLSAISPLSATHIPQ